MLLNYDFDKLTDNFNINEFNSKDGKLVPVQYFLNCVYISNILEIIRKEVGSIKINSGYRSDYHNSNIGGSKNSNHLRAMAVDILPVTCSYSEFKSTISEMISKGLIPNGEVIYYDKNGFIHYAPNISEKFVKRCI